MAKVDDRHLGTRQHFYLSGSEYRTVKSAMADMGYANKSQFFRDAIFRAIQLHRLGKEAKWRTCRA